MENEKKIREQLEALLKQVPTDYSKVLDLSTKLAAFDEGFARFTVDAGVIDRLGKELVAKQETAVSELIKNSYDADASTTKVSFQDSDETGGTLSIEDDGDGMSKDELINGFMRISATTKIHNPFTHKFKRKRAGKKGIGRFAVQRLGSRLTIITQTRQSDKAIKITINWDHYQNDKNILQIANKIELLPKQRSHGTLLQIENLRDKWSETAIKRIYRYVTAIVLPYPLSVVSKNSERKRLKITRDPGFKVSFVKRSGKKEIIIADENQMIFSYAVAIMEGYVDKRGSGDMIITSKKLAIKRKMKIGLDNQNRRNWQYIRNIHFKAHYFIYHRDFIPGQQRTAISELAEEIGGIRLYNNGFRVLPYGEPYADWLKLDYSVRKRDVLPPHGNNNFFGFVEVTPLSGLLEETSSREGLQENEAFQELQNFIHKGLIAGVREVARVRGVKQTAGQKNWEKKKPKPSQIIKEIASQVAEAADLLEDDDANNVVVRQLKRFSTAIIEAANEQQQTEAKLVEELGMIRILASLGLSIAEFTHEIRHYMGSLEADVKVLSKLTTNKKALGQIQHVINSVNRLRVYASYYDRTVADNVIRQLEPQNLSSVLNKFFKVVGPDVKRNSIKFEEIQIEVSDLLTIPMHPSELISVLFNLYTNAKKAIARADSDGRIGIRAGRIKERVFIEFSDNGDGIPAANKARIFDAFFTTASPSKLGASQQEEVVGTGLGLKIVKDIIESYNGSVTVTTSPKGYRTTFRIELPRFKNNL